MTTSRHPSPRAAQPEHAGAPVPTSASTVLRCADIDAGSVVALLARLGLQLVTVADGQPVPGSFWGEAEAGLKGRTVYVRADTPVHSVLHEASHAACMSPDRRHRLDTDAGGDDLEECAVCYLQVLLADTLAEVGAARMLADMDSWGYSFRLGSARRWFVADADDAREWLVRRRLLPLNT